MEPRALIRQFSTHNTQPPGRNRALDDIELPEGHPDWEKFKEIKKTQTVVQEQGYDRSRSKVATTNVQTSASRTLARSGSRQFAILGATQPARSGSRQLANPGTVLPPRYPHRLVPPPHKTEVQMQLWLRREAWLPVHGTYQWLASQYELESCIQEDGESIRHYIARRLKKNISKWLARKPLQSFGMVAPMSCSHK